MSSYNIVEAHCHVAEFTSSGGIDEQFAWHRNQKQNVSALVSSYEDGAVCSGTSKHSTELAVQL